MMNGLELNDEEVRSEINEGIEDYQNEKDQVSWDIPLNANDVASVEPGEIFVKEGWKITPEGSIATAVELIKTVKNEVFIVDTLSYEQLKDIIREAEEHKIEDAVEVKEDLQILTKAAVDDEIEEVESFAPEKEPQEEDEEFDDELEEVPAIDNTEIPVEPVVPNETETPVDTPEVPVEEEEEEEETEEPIENVPVDTKPEEPIDNLPVEPTTPEEPVIDTPVEEEHTDEPIVDTKPEEDTPDLPTDEETVEDTPAEDEKEPAVEEPNTDTTEETPTTPNTDIPNQPEVPVEEEKPIIDEKPEEPEIPVDNTPTDTENTVEEEPIIDEPVKEEETPVVPETPVEDTEDTTPIDEPTSETSEEPKDNAFDNIDLTRGCYYDMHEDKVINFSEEFKNAPNDDIRRQWAGNLTTLIKIIKEINTGVVSSISIKYNFTHVELHINSIIEDSIDSSIVIHTLLLSLHGEIILAEDGISRLTGIINPDIVNYDNRFRDAINCKWSHEYDTYTTRELDANGLVNERYYIVSKENRQMQSLFYEPIQKTIESFTPVASDNQHIASVYLTKDEYDNLEDRVTTIEHLDPVTNKVEEFKYAIKKSITLIDAIDARSTQLVFQRLELINDTYYVAAEYRSKIFIEAVKDITIY